MNSTLEDVKKYVETTGKFSENYKKKIVGRLNAYAKKTNRTLASIPADLSVFEQEFGKGRSEPIPAGYKTKQQANTAASEIRSALKVFLENRSPEDFQLQQTTKDAWDAVVLTLASRGVDRKPLISVSVLIQKCRASEKQPADVTHDFLMQIVRNSVTSGEYKAVQRAWALIELHALAISQHVALPHTLPFPSLAKTRNVCRRRKLPASLQEQFSKWADMKLNPRHAGVVLRDGVNAGVSKRTISSAYEGLTYYYTCIVELGHMNADADPALSEIIDFDMFYAVVSTELDGEFSWEKLSTTTLHGYIKRTLSIAAELGLGCAHIQKEILRYRVFAGTRKMSAKRKLWCQRLLADKNRVRAFYNLPNATFKTAAAQMRDYETLSFAERQKAVKTSIAACAFAIMLSLPLRIGTMLQLKHSGVHADVFAFEDKSDLIINTTPDMVKNGYAHERVRLTQKVGGSPKLIVKWFIEDVHPLLVRDHVITTRQKPDLLFAGIGYHRLLEAIVDNAVDHGIDLTPHLFRHGIATLLANEPRADFALIAALLGDTPATVMRNYAFVDQARLHVAGQDKLAAAQKDALRVRSFS